MRRERWRPRRGLERVDRRASLAREAVELHATAVEPAERTFHRRAGGTLVGAALDQLVELHDAVGTEVALDAHHRLGGVVVHRAVEWAAEDDPLLGHRAELCEGEDLEAPGVGEHRALPAREGVEAAEGADHRVAGAQVEMEGVAEDHAAAGGGDFIDREPFDGAMRSDRHEGRRLDDPVRRGEAAGAGGAVVVRGLEREVGHPEVSAKRGRRGRV